MTVLHLALHCALEHSNQAHKNVERSPPVGVATTLVRDDVLERTISKSNV